MKSYITLAYGKGDLHVLATKDAHAKYPLGKITFSQTTNGEVTVSIDSDEQSVSMMPTDKGVADLKAKSAVSEGNGDNTDFTPEEVSYVTDRRYLSGRQIAEGQQLLKLLSDLFEGSPRGGHSLSQKSAEEVHRKVQRVLELLNSATS
jgi:hypothetical protein